MPEYNGVKITRAEEKARHAFRRELERAMRQVAKGSNWRCTGGTLFRDMGGWFVEVYPSVFIFRRETRAALRLKPMGIDPIFWDIVNTPENHGSSLSFRALGAWTCRTPPFSEMVIDEVDMNAPAAAQHVLNWANSEATRLEGKITLDSFLSFIDSQPAEAEKGAYLAARVTTLVMLGRAEQARRLCEEARAQSQPGGFFAQGGTFPEMALGWLASREGRWPT
jgi:hypothetical protein